MDMITVEKRDFAVKAKKLRRLGLVPGTEIVLRISDKTRGPSRAAKQTEE